VGACLALGVAFGPGVSAAAVRVTLMGRMKLPNSVFLTNVVGYSDPATRREYAILGDDRDKVYIVDVTDPTSPTLTAQIGGIPGFDVKTWDHYLYTCDGNTTGSDSRVVDLADPFNPTVLADGFPSAHTLQVSASGILYAEFPGLRIYDLSDPTSPALLYQTGGEGHDSTPLGTRLYDFHGRDGTVIWDVTDPSDPDTLGVISDPAIVFHHSGDATADQNTLFVCDELITHPGPDVTIWDISDPATPVRIGRIAEADATVHNVYVVGDLLYAAYYSAGFAVFDVSDPVHPVRAAGYDTSKRTGEGFVGAIGAFVVSPGRVYVCDIENGLFVFTVVRDVPLPASPEAAFALAQNTPNPFRSNTRISFELRRSGRVSLAVYDVAGRRVRALFEGPLPAGTRGFEWDGRDDSGSAVASGVYFYRVDAGPHTETRRMVLVR
jgi:choice-of-anchor B domain-containing protein